MYEYLSDKNEKDRISQNLYRGLKILGDEAKRREIALFYKKCRSIYDEVYYEWRELSKALNDLILSSKQNQNN